jgi:hypothetical protein
MRCRLNIRMVPAAGYRQCNMISRLCSIACLPRCGDSREHQREVSAVARRRCVGERPQVHLKTYEKCDALRNPTHLATPDTVSSFCSRSCSAHRMRISRIRPLVEQPRAARSRRLTCMRLYPNSLESEAVLNSGSARCFLVTSITLLMNTVSLAWSKAPDSSARESPKITGCLMAYPKYWI